MYEDKKMKEYNLRHVTSISIKERELSDWYTYRKGKRFLSFEMIKEGFYEMGLFVSKETPNGLILIDGQLFYKPYVEIKILNENTVFKIFESVTECEIFVSTLKHDIKYYKGDLFAPL